MGRAANHRRDHVQGPSRGAVSRARPGRRRRRRHPVVRRAHQQGALGRQPSPRAVARAALDAARDRRPSHPERHHQARRLRHATYALLADRSQPRHRRRARLDLRPAPELRGRLGRAHDGRASRRFVQPPGAAQSRSDDGHQRRRDAARHAGRVGRPRLRRQRPLRLALHRRPGRHLRRARRRRRRLGRGRGARAGARHGHAPVRRDDRLHGRGGRGAGPLRLDLLRRSRPRRRAWTSRACSPTTSSAARPATRAGATRSPSGCSPRACRPPRRRSRPRCASRSAARTTGPSRQLARYIKEVGENTATDMHVRLDLAPRPLPARRRPDPVPPAGLSGGALHRAQRELRPPAPGRPRGERQAVRRPAAVRRLRATPRAWRASTARRWPTSRGPRRAEGGHDRHGAADQRHDADAGTANPEPDLAGYEVVWRESTDPCGRTSIPVGNVTDLHDPGLSKDNVQVGVRAVDRNGYRSPVAFPVPSS